MSQGPERVSRCARIVLLSAALALAAAACAGPAPAPSSPAGSGAAAPAAVDGAGPYPVSPAGGTPATGPGDRYNDCERIFCLRHDENYFVDHFLRGHVGWIVHDDRRGDVFVPSGRTSGPGFPEAAREALRLCGAHVHPWLLSRGGGPIRHTGYNRALGYSRAHFEAYGTRLDPCCVNGAGWSFLHSGAGRRFPFHALDEYRERPEIGWQRPFRGRAR